MIAHRLVGLLIILQCFFSCLGFGNSNEWPHTYHHWWSEYFTEAERYDAGLPGEDADGDGLNNFKEYAFGLHPRQVDRCWYTISGHDPVRLSYFRPHDAVDLSYVHRAGFHLNELLEITPTITNVSAELDIVGVGATNSPVYFFHVDPQYEEEIAPISDVICWGDSLTYGGYSPYLDALFGGNRNVVNMGIGGETSSEIKDRMLGHVLSFPGDRVFVEQGNELIFRTDRVVPSRLLDENYRSLWSRYSKCIDCVYSVEFFVEGKKVGESHDPQQAGVGTDIAQLPTKMISFMHPFVEGEEIYFRGDVKYPLNITGERVYYVRNPNWYSFEVAEYPNSPAIHLGSNIEGELVAIGGYEFSWTGTGEWIDVSVRTFTEKDNSIALIWVGANNITQVETIKADIQSMVSHLKSLERRFLILTCLNNAVASPKGTYGYRSMEAVNSWILEAYPSNYIDVFGELLEAYDSNSPQDVEDVSNRVVPSSLRKDHIHLNYTGNRLVARWIYNEIITRKW